MRQVYAWLVRMHPAWFRLRFAEEMLWVFDCASGEGRGAGALGALLVDAAASLARQWVWRNDTGEIQAAGAQWRDSRVPAFYCAPDDGPAPGPRAAGYVVSLLVMTGLFLLMGRDGQRIARIVIGTVTPFHLLDVQTGNGPVKLTTKVGVKSRKEVPVSGFLWEYFQGMPVLLAIDRDHDLTISPEEMAAAPEALRRLDKNGDGKLSPEECGFQPPPARADEVASTLAALDRNGDGKLDRSEIPESMQGLFPLGSLERGGTLRAEQVERLAVERRAGPKPPADLMQRARIWFMRVHPVLAAMDTDGNGELSKVEISTAAAGLRAMDWNSDGILTRDELLPDHVTSEVAKMMSRWDSNGDGRIAKAEIPADATGEARDLLRRADRDRDGEVTEQELRNELRRMGDSHAAPPARLVR